MNSQSLARGLAFFSVGLGLAELLAPRPVARTIGIDEDYENLLRFFGLREIGSGLGILQGNPAVFLWSRVLGDAVDLACLSAALKSRHHERNRVIGAIAAVAGVAALDVWAAILHSRKPADEDWRVNRASRTGWTGGEAAKGRGYADKAMADSGQLRDRNFEAAPTSSTLPSMAGGI
jgi:hypothetical protein